MVKTYWSASEVAAYIGVTREAVRLMVRRGELTAAAEVHDGANRKYRIFEPEHVMAFDKWRRQRMGR